MNGVIVHDPVPELFPAGVLGGAHIVGEIHVVGDLADQQGGGDMHIEGQASRGAVSPKLFRCQRIRNKVAPEPAVFFRDTDSKQASTFQVFPVLVGKRSISIRVERTPRKVDSRGCHPLNNVATFRRE